MDIEKDVTLEDLREGYFAANGEENETGYAQSEPEIAEENTADVQPKLVQNEQTMPVSEASVRNDSHVPTDNVTQRYTASMEHMSGIERLRAENEALKAELAKVNTSGIEQADEVNATVAEQLTGSDIPSFDDESYNFASDAERKQIMAEYTRSLVDYAVNKAQTDMLNRVAPLIDEHDKAIENAAFDEALRELGATNEFSDISAYGDDVRRICKRDEFNGMKPYQRVTLAALVARGMHNNPLNEEKDIGKRADEILRDEELMRELETRKAMKLHDSRTDYPKQSASGSLSAAAFEPPKKAQSIEELRGMYGAI